ncbi:MAG: alanine racemase [Phycisphaeraceae bacterium]|nr:MAG: alanine racemase [Phycisphaeraceae bacterium]
MLRPDTPAAGRAPRQRRHPDARRPAWSLPVDTPSRLEIDLTAIERNVATMRRVCSASQGRSVGVCAVLKADAYGLGAPRVAKRLEIAAVEMVAVFTPDQARSLVESAIRCPILVLMPVRSFNRTDTLHRALVEGRLHLSVHDEQQLQSLISHTDRFGLRLPVHVEVNMGMNRGGARPDEAERLLKRIHAHPRLILAGLYTHFPSADTDNSATRELAIAFESWRRSVADSMTDACIVHMANTFGAFRSHELHADMVRIGLALIGYAQEEIADPDACELVEHAGSLLPAVRWSSQIVHVSQVSKGETVGYGGAWKAKRRTRLGLVPVGYADGYPLTLSDRGRVGVKIGAEGGAQETAFAPVVGRVSMDQITIDITDLPEDAVGVGTGVELIGLDREAPNHLPTLARTAGTISHDFLCGLSSRVQRAYRSTDSQTTAAVDYSRG